MAKNFHIVVEGESDKLFVTEYLQHINLSSSVPEFIKNLDGIGNLAGHTQKMQEHLNDGVKVLLIFDANSNFRKRRKSIEKIINMKINDQNLPLFLFPNNKSRGALENLLEQIIWRKHAGIFECFENYEKCLQDKNNGYILPDMKGKIYAYTEALDAKGKANQYRSEYWDFHHSALNPLKTFLIENIK